MVTSRISYSLHCDIGHIKERVVPLHELSRLHVDHQHDNDMPTLYVAMATWIPKCNMYNVDSEVTPEKIVPESNKEIVPESNKDTLPESNKEVETESIKETVPESNKEIVPDSNKEIVPESNKEVETESINKIVPESDKEIEKETEPESELDTSQVEENEFESTLENEDCELTPERNPQDVKPGTESTSSRKKLPAERLKAREEREKKRQEARETKEKMKQEKIQQKIKERQEKEEQKKKEKLDKEEQKRKEREEKEEQRKKEREEKEEQRKKEKEEKEEQKRKEREEREIKKQQDLVKDKKKYEKESALFVNFFVARKSATPAELKKEEFVSSFMPFEVKADMRLAPTTRCNLSDDQKDSLTKQIETQDKSTLYLKEIKTRPLRKCQRTWPTEDGDEVIVVEDTGLGECVEEQPKASKMRAKLLKFHENRRPAYFGTWRKKSKTIRPRHPFSLDKDLFDYEVDSDDDWEEEEPGESLRGSDDEDKENESDEYEVDNEFFVPHGYLSDEEAETEENQSLTPETQKEKLKMLQMEFEEEMKSKTERIKPRLIGCIWDSKLKPKIQDAINTFLGERMMIVPGPIIIQKRDLTKDNKRSTTKNTPSRRQLSQELIPDFLRMIHGNTNNQTLLVNEFLSYIALKNASSVSKAGLSSQLKEYAKWRKCPEEGPMYNKFCWFVNEDVRKQYNLNLTLPNKWSYTNDDNVHAKKKLSL